MGCLSTGCRRGRKLCIQEPDFALADAPSFIFSRVLHLAHGALEPARALDDAAAVVRPGWPLWPGGAAAGARPPEEGPGDEDQAPAPYIRAWRSGAAGSLPPAGGWPGGIAAAPLDGAGYAGAKPYFARAQRAGRARPGKIPRRVQRSEQPRSAAGLVRAGPAGSAGGPSIEGARGRAFLDPRRPAPWAERRQERSGTHRARPSLVSAFC